MHTIEMMTDIDDSKLMYVDPITWQEYCVKWVNEYLRKSENDISGLCQDLEFSHNAEEMEALYESDNNAWFEAIVAAASIFKESQIQDLILEDERVI